IENARLHEREQRARSTAERLLRVTAALAASLTVEEVHRVIAREGMQAAGADGALAAALSDDGSALELRAACGYPEGSLGRWERMPLEADVPLVEALRTGEAIFVESGVERAERFPGVAGTGHGHAFAALPL